MDWKFCLKLGVSAFLLYLAIHYWEPFMGLVRLLLGVATPLLLGCVIAYIINIPMSFYERRLLARWEGGRLDKLRRPAAMLLAFLSVLVIAALVILVVAPELAKCVSILVAQVPGTLERITDTLAHSQYLSDRIAQALENINWNDTLSKVVNTFLSGFGNVANYAVGVVSSVVSGVVNGFIAFIFSIYLLLGRDRLHGQVKRVARRYLPARWREGLRYVLDILNQNFHRYIVGQCTEAVILGALCALGMLLFRFPYAAVVGATVGFTALIPVAGAYIGGAVGFLLILTVSPWKALLFLLYLVILQQLEGNIVYPKVVGTSMGLPGLWVLAAVIVGGGVAGIPGMALSVPFTASLYQLLRNDLNRPRPDAA